MIPTPGLRWILTVLFSVIALFSLYRVSRPGTSSWTRLIHVLHALMGVAMLVMVWPWGMNVPAVPEAVVFGLATAWFLLLTALPAGASPVAPDGGHPRLHNALHATMTGAMTWMILAMPTGASAHGSAGSAGGMPGMPGMATGGSAGAMSMSLHGTPRTVAGLLCAFFVLTGLWWLARSFDTARGADPNALRQDDGSGVDDRAYDAGCHGGMALGMAIMLLMMT